MNQLKLEKFKLCFDFKKHSLYIVLKAIQIAPFEGYYQNVEKLIK
jgi:hypothetical protein